MSSATRLVALAIMLTAPGGPFGGWHQEVADLGGALTTDLAADRGAVTKMIELRTDLHEVNGPYDAPQRARTGRATASERRYTPDVERWRPVVESFFHPGDVDWALRVIQCESGGDPNAANPRSSARGLFQHLHRVWPERAFEAGWPGSSVYDPLANIAVGAWLYYEDGPSHWVCR